MFHFLQHNITKNWNQYKMVPLLNEWIMFIFYFSFSFSITSREMLRKWLYEKAGEEIGKNYPLKMSFYYVEFNIPCMFNAVCVFPEVISDLLLICFNHLFKY